MVVNKRGTKLEVVKSLRLDSEVVEKVRSLASREHRNIGQQFRVLIELGLERYETQEQLER